LRLHGDHWSAWESPDLPPDQEVHRIEPGDTLWDLAGRFYGDPHLWPQLWERNTYILDAHWIYPGDNLVMPGVAVEDQLGDAGGGLAQPPLDSEEALVALEPTEGDGAEDEGAKKELGRGRAAMAGSSGPVPLGHESDIYCSGYIGAPDESFALSVTGSEYDYLNPSLVPGKLSNIEGVFGKAETAKYELSVGDVVYLDGGRGDGVAPGALYTAIEAEGVVRHPRDGGVLGRYFRYLGRIRVLSAQASTAIGEVIFSCDGITVGAKLKRFEPEPIPLRRLTAMRPINFPASDEKLIAGPRIVYSHEELVALGVGHLVFIDQGADDNVAPGDIFTVYRRTEPGIPPIVLGEVGVLSVGQTTALARILASRYTVYLGDALLPK